MSEKNRDSFKLVAACSVALVAIAATYVFCVRSAAKQSQRRTYPRTEFVIEGIKRENEFKPSRMSPADFNAPRKFVRDEKSFFAKSLVNLLAEYDYIIKKQSKEDTPTILSQIRIIEVSPSGMDANSIVAVLSLSIKKANVSDWVRRANEYEARHKLPRGPWPQKFIFTTPQKELMINRVKNITNRESKRLPQSDLPPNLQPKQPAAIPSSER